MLRTPAATKQYQMLPHARPGGIAGLLEILADRNGHEDIFRLAETLSYELDDLLPTVEAASIMEFLRVSEGDAEITPTGRSLVEADILRRKELFRKAAVEHVALIRQITRSLEAKSDHKLGDEFFHDLLDEHFTESETLLQLETATLWGRYSELFDHDSTGQFFFIPEKSREGAAESSS